MRILLIKSINNKIQARSQMLNNPMRNYLEKVVKNSKLQKITKISHQLNPNMETLKDQTSKSRKQLPHKRSHDDNLNHEPRNN